MNTRRKIVIALCASMAALARAPRSLAQAPDKVWRVGFLALSRIEIADSDQYVGAFRLGMRQHGYVEGRNLVIEWRGANGRIENLPRLAEELLALRVDVIVAVGTTAIAAAQKASSTIPIVMATSSDPIGTGFVKTLSRPGGNITGLSNMSANLGAKQLELLRIMVPKLSSVSFLFNPANPSTIGVLKDAQTATKKLGVKVLPQGVATPAQIENAFQQMNAQAVGAVIVPTDGFFSEQRRQIIELARKYRLPSMFVSSLGVEAGGLMSYGADYRENYRRSAAYVDRIFRGAKPGDLPVEQPTKLQLVINGKTASELGLTVPPSLLVSADQVID
jgi:putative ABC transport system substrate-binding protein